MKNFAAAPQIPSDYGRLRALSPDEINVAAAAGYVAKPVVDRNGDTSANINSCLRPSDDIRDWRTRIPQDDIRDWRMRIYVIWFCYIYEHLKELERPLEAIESIILEFRAPAIIDTPERRLGTLYAGMGATNPVSANERERQLQVLRPHYEKAISLISAFGSPRST